MHLSPTNVCIPAIAIKSRVDNVLLTNQILLGVSDFGKSPIYLANWERSYNLTTFRLSTVPKKVVSSLIRLSVKRSSDGLANMCPSICLPGGYSDNIISGRVVGHEAGSQWH